MEKKNPVVSHKESSKLCERRRFLFSSHKSHSSWWRSPNLKGCQFSQSGLMANFTSDSLRAFLLVAQHASEHTHTHPCTHNRDIIKHRDIRRDSQLIWGFLPMHPPPAPPSLCLSQLLGFLSLHHSRQSYCPRATNLSPLTQDLTHFFKKPPAPPPPLPNPH